MPTARITANIEGRDIELTINYEVVGEGRPWLLTPGGRFSTRYPGVRELAGDLAALGNRVVFWDRPNTGASDLCFEGGSISAMQADFAAGLLRHLGLAPAIIIGGSGGARCAILIAARHRDVAKGLGVWWLTGGVHGRLSHAVNYAAPSINAAWNGGMEAVAKLPQWQECLESNPKSRARLLAQDPRKFIDVMEKWTLNYCPCHDDELVPDLKDSEARKLDVPTLILRSGATDPMHTRATTEALARLLPNAKLVEPPWPDTAWIDAPRDALFTCWRQAAPMLHEWADARVR